MPLVASGDALAGRSMKGAICERYGPPEVVKIREVPKPVPAQGEVLINARATTVNSGDARVRALRVPRGLRLPMRLKLGLTKPKQPILGLEVAGQVEAVGSAVTRFHPGDRVVASRGFDFGCHAEYVAVAEGGGIAPIPGSLMYEDAVALCFGGMTALHFFGLGKLARGETVLINGASGAVGTMAVQLASHLGAQVTAVCSGANAELVRGLGADHVIDYTTADFASDGQRYDVIMDNHGNAPYSKVKDCLKPGGRFLMVVGNLPQTLAASWQKATISGSQNDASVTADSYRTLMSLAEQGVLKPVIDSVLPFEQIVEAHRRVDGGHKVGSVVLTFEQAG
ncbi:MAG TPA: NAD(P)-dependent alcohol dehydrogenase [Acidimicrobiales bacterium]|nr:NAD(P)-dependent alcohol dehydrogenase [Acidimicrobiales bacterium]